MAGAIDVDGNAPNVVAEYNVWVDALAAKRVVEAMPVELVPLDASNHAPATTFFVDAIASRLHAPAARAVHALVAENPQVLDGTYFFWDPLAAVLVVEPALGTWERAPLLVTASLDAGAGWVSRSARGTPTRFATGADGLAFERVFLSTITGERVDDVRPAPDLVVTFDGRTCATDGRTLGREDVVVAFENGSDEAASIVVAALSGITYEETMGMLGPAGSVVVEAPRGLEQTAWADAPAGARAFASVRVADAGAAVFCLVPAANGARVWPAGPLRVRT